MLSINGKNYDIYCSQDDFNTLLKKICESDEEEINQSICLQLNSDLQGYLSKLNDFDKLISMRKILDIGLSRHQYSFENIEKMYAFINNYICKFHKLKLLPEPTLLQSFDNKRKYSPQNLTDPFYTSVLYRGVSLLEYINIFTRMEMPCSGNYFSPQCPYVINNDTGEEDILNLPNYNILLEFTLDDNLDNLLKGETVIKEKGNYKQIKDITLIEYDKKKKQEIRYGIKHEKNVISFRMGNARQYGKCYLWDFQKHLQSIEVVKANIKNPDSIKIYMEGAKSSNYCLRYNEIEDYLDLLNNHYTFDS